MTAPGFWMHETSGVLRPVVEKYLTTRAPLDDDECAVMRAYLRQWMASPDWRGPDVIDLCLRIDGLTSRPRIDRWLHDALDAGIDPL